MLWPAGQRMALVATIAWQVIKSIAEGARAKSAPPLALMEIRVKGVIEPIPADQFCKFGRVPNCWYTPAPELT